MAVAKKKVKKVAKKAAKPTKKVAKKVEKKPAKKSGGRGAALKIKYNCSPELAAVIGKKQVNRGDMMKLIWLFIKKHKLNAGQMIKPAGNKLLSDLLGKKDIIMFKMTKVLSTHLSAIE